MGHMEDHMGKTCEIKQHAIPQMLALFIVTTYPNAELYLISLLFANPIILPNNFFNTEISNKQISIIRNHNVCANDLYFINRCQG